VNYFVAKHWHWGHVPPRNLLSYSVNAKNAPKHFIITQMKIRKIFWGVGTVLLKPLSRWGGNISPHLTPQVPLRSRSLLCYCGQIIVILHEVMIFRLLTVFNYHIVLCCSGLFL